MLRSDQLVSGDEDVSKHSTPEAFSPKMRENFSMSSSNANTSSGDSQSDSSLGRSSRIHHDRLRASRAKRLSRVVEIESDDSPSRKIRKLNDEDFLATTTMLHLADPDSIEKCFTEIEEKKSSTRKVKTRIDNQQFWSSAGTEWIRILIFEYQCIFPINTGLGNLLTEFILQHWDEMVVRPMERMGLPSISEIRKEVLKRLKHKFNHERPSYCLHHSLKTRTGVPNRDTMIAYGHNFKLCPHDPSWLLEALNRVHSQTEPPTSLRDCSDAPENLTNREMVSEGGDLTSFIQSQGSVPPTRWQSSHRGRSVESRGLCEGNWFLAPDSTSAHALPNFPTLPGFDSISTNVEPSVRRMRSIHEESNDSWKQERILHELYRSSSTFPKPASLCSLSMSSVPSPYSSSFPQAWNIPLAGANPYSSMFPYMNVSYPSGSLESPRCSRYASSVHRPLIGAPLQFQDRSPSRTVSTYLPEPALLSMQNPTSIRCRSSRNNVDLKWHPPFTLACPNQARSSQEISMTTGFASSNSSLPSKSSFCS